MKDTVEYWLKRTAQEGDCLVWTKCCNTDGYPRAVYKGSSNGKVHRIVYQLSHPEVDISNKVVRHKCDNPKCINPDHLVIGTVADNMMDRDVRGRSATAKLKPEQVLLIRKLYESGEYTQRALASIFNVDSRTISSVHCRTTHRWVR